MALICALAENGSRTVLALGQTIDAVVKENVVDVEVAPQGVHEVIAANRQSITRRR
jgi:hypothetical protein